MKSILLSIIAALLVPAVACADQLSDAKAAYQRYDWDTALKLWQPLAEKGNAEAQAGIGQLYLSGQGVEYSRDKATEFFHKAADQGNAEGEYWLGYVYEISPPDWKKDYSGEVSEWYGKAAEQGYVPAELRLAGLYEHGGRESKPNLGEAFKLYSAAADKGNVEAEYDTGRFYHDGLGVERDYAKALALYKKAADQGHPLARLALGQMYANGEGVKQDAAEAAKWRNAPKLPEEITKALDSVSSVTLYSIQPLGGPDIPEWEFHGHHQLGHTELTQQKAKQAIAALNNAVSQGTADMMSMCMFSPRHAIRVTSNGDIYDIVICYQCGQLELFKNDKPLPFSGSIAGKPGILNGLLQEVGIPLADDKAALQHSYEEEAKVAMREAERGDKKAQEVIGKFLMAGHGVNKDENQGIQWLAKSYGTSTDDPNFEIKLGNLLLHSRDGQSNHAVVQKLFQDAADKGNPEGQYQLGYFYQVYGKGDADRAEALKWLGKAADQGNPKAQFEFGVFYARGWNEKQDYSEAMKWFRKAAEQGHPEAMSWLKTMYEKGEGVDKDAGEAFFWERLAQEYHSTMGGPSLYATSEQKAAAEKRVAEWKSSHQPCANDCHF